MAKSKRFEFDWSEVEAEEQKLETPKSNSYDDPRFYKIKVNEEGKFFATIRFLPPAEGEVVAKIPYNSHFFKRNGVYSELCPKTIGKYCPVCKHTYEVYEKFGKELAKKKNDGMYPKNNWVSNILVISDEQNPENNGKVFLWKYGKTVNDIIEDIKNPEDSEVEPIKYPFDFKTGADFRISVYMKSDYPQYDKCKFRSTSPLFDMDEDKLNEVYDSIYKLSELIDESQFGTFDELQEKLNTVLNIESSSEDSSSNINEEFDQMSKAVNESSEEADNDMFMSKEKEDVKETKSEKVKEDKVDLNEIDNEDDFFAKMREDD